MSVVLEFIEQLPMMEVGMREYPVDSSTHGPQLRQGRFLNRRQWDMRAINVHVGLKFYFQLSGWFFQFVNNTKATVANILTGKA